jgi:ATP-dependent Lon protease
MIQKELGEDEDEAQVADEFSKKLKKLKLSDANRKKVEKEIKRFRTLSDHSPESSYLRTWLDTVMELPWQKVSSDKLNIADAAKILDKSHYGLKEVKDRVLEAIAVLEMRKREKASANLPTILCFVGPPGVGKTSIGKSVAAALGRKFTKIALGGVRDEAEIRGHRRTYVGAMPGRIIAGVKQAGTSNPVFMLDEIDKLGNDYRGDPSSALLEVLDPAQNNTFEDHYLDMPYDLSKAIFITTANSLEIPPALRDRLEIITYSGYTTSEKIEIARQHLFEKNLVANGLKKTQLVIEPAMYQAIIEGYTKEAGVRELERLLNKIMRKVARELLESPKLKKVQLTTKKLTTYLGPRLFDPTLQNKADEAGVAAGLAWTSVGGDVLFIETTLTPGKGDLKLTGKLGEVMKESAQAALTYVKSQADKLGIDREMFDKNDLHVHVPEGAVPKDGPSAGITMATAIASAFTGRKVRKDIAMTGEVTLRGQVLRIGGLKEKAIAAHRSGCKTVLIPAENKRDLIDIPDEVKADITFIPVKHVSEVLKKALV